MQRTAFHPFQLGPFGMYPFPPWRRGRFTLINIENCAPNETLVQLYHSITEEFMMLDEMAASMKNNEWGSLNEKEYTRALENPPDYEDESAVRRHMETLRRHAGRRISFLRARLIVEAALKDLKKRIHQELKPHLDQMKPQIESDDHRDQKKKQSLKINYMMARRLVHTISEFIGEQENFLAKTSELSRALCETLDREFDKLDKGGSMDDKTFWTNLTR